MPYTAHKVMSYEHLSNRFVLNASFHNFDLEYGMGENCFLNLSLIGESSEMRIQYLLHLKGKEISNKWRIYIHTVPTQPYQSIRPYSRFNRNMGRKLVSSSFDDWLNRRILEFSFVVLLWNRRKCICVVDSHAFNEYHMAVAAIQI